MNTDDLIARLAAKPAVRRAQPSGASVALGLAAATAATLALFMSVFGPRPELMAALAEPLTSGKTLLAAALGLLALPASLRLSRPGQGAGSAGRALWLIPAAAVGLLGLAFLWTEPAQRLRLFIGSSIPICLPAIVLLSAPLTAGLLAWLRRGAPEHPVRCGALAGLAAAGFATALFSLYCTEDSPLFYVPWYGTGILIATGIGAVAGHLWLRW